jgi:hypothetical protein
VVAKASEKHVQAAVLHGYLKYRQRFPYPDAEEVAQPSNPFTIQCSRGHTYMDPSLETRVGSCGAFQAPGGPRLLVGLQELGGWPLQVKLIEDQVLTLFLDIHG